MFISARYQFYSSGLQNHTSSSHNILKDQRRNILNQTQGTIKIYKHIWFEIVLLFIIVRSLFDSWKI